MSWPAREFAEHAAELDALPISEAAQIEFSNGGDTRQRITLTSNDRKLAVTAGLDPIRIAQSRLNPDCWKPTHRVAPPQEIDRAQTIRTLRQLIEWLEDTKGP